MIAIEIKSQFGKQNNNKFVDKNHQWLMRFVGESLMRIRMFACSQVFPHMILINYKENKNLTVEKSGRHSFNQAKFTSAVIRHIDIMCILILFTEKGVKQLQ